MPTIGNPRRYDHHLDGPGIQIQAAAPTAENFSPIFGGSDGYFATPATLPALCRISQTIELMKLSAGIKRPSGRRVAAGYSADATKHLVTIGSGQLSLHENQNTIRAKDPRIVQAPTPMLKPICATADSLPIGPCHNKPRIAITRPPIRRYCMIGTMKFQDDTVVGSHTMSK